MRSKLADLFNGIAANATTFAQPVLAHLCRMAAIEAENASLPWTDTPRLSIAGIWDWDITNDLNRVDPAGAYLLGVLPSRAGKGLPNGAYLKAVHPDDVGAISRSLGKAMSGGAWEAKYRIITSGQPRWAVAKGFCFIDKSNRPERFTGAIMAEDEGYGRGDCTFLGKIADKLNFNGAIVVPSPQRARRPDGEAIQRIGRSNIR
jgi:hypothetical protein